MPDETPDQLSIDECQAEVIRIGKLFDAEEFHLGQLFSNHLVVIATQVNSIVQLLIKKGIITEEESNLNYFNLLKDRMQEWEEHLLPQVREARLRNKIVQNGQVDQQMQQFPGLLGPDGKPLL